MQNDSPDSSTHNKSQDLLDALQGKSQSPTKDPEVFQSSDYDHIINEKLKFLEEYEALEKELETKRQQLETEFNISLNKSRGGALATPEKKVNPSSVLMKSTGNLMDIVESPSQDSQALKLSKTFKSLEKENVEAKEFANYYLRMSSETKIKEKDEENYTFKPKINKSSTKKKLVEIAENPKDQSITQSRLDELYKQGVMKKQKHEELIKQLNEDIKGNVNKNKVGQYSQKIIQKNMEKSLAKLMLELEDPENKGHASFQDIGSLMFKLSIFKGSHYKRSSFLEKPVYDPANIEKFGAEILVKESQFHEDFWTILLIPQLITQSQGNAEKAKEILAENSVKNVNCKLLLDVILLLLDTSKDKNTVAGLLRERLFSSFKKKESLIKENNKENEENFQDIFKSFEGVVSMTLEKFVGKFRKLFVDKTKIMSIYLTKEMKNLEKEKEQQLLMEKTYDFKPKINDKSKKQELQANYVAKLVTSGSLKEIVPQKDLPKTRYDLLYNYSKYESKKKEEDTKERLKEDSRDCTFAPKINKKISNSNKKNDKNIEESNKTNESPQRDDNITNKNNENNDNDPRKTYEKLYELYKKKFEREQLNSKILQEREEEKLTACTFKPQLNTNKNLEKSLYSSNNVKGAEKVIERVAKAREERQEKQTLFENMGKPKGDPLQPTVFQPFSFEKRYEKDKDNNNKEEPLLYLDINYGPGKIARIPVRKTDDPHVLCKTFSKIYSLNEKMQATLLETIQNIFTTQVWEEKK